MSDERKKTRRSGVRKALAITTLLGLGALGAAWGINAQMTSRAEARMYDHPDDVPERYVAIVLGARVMPSGVPSHSLEDRLRAALELWRSEKVERILVTGDHGEASYNEVAVMHRWLRDHGVPASKIFVDHAGFRTLDSMERAARVFRVEDAIVCTQEFHLPRSLFLAERAGIDAVGYVADRRNYSRRVRRHNRRREFIARVVAALDSYVLGTEPRYLGEPIPITGDASASFDSSISAPPTASLR